MKDGRVALAREAMPLDRGKRTTVSSQLVAQAQLVSIGSLEPQKACPSGETHLLNILPDDSERAAMSGVTEVEGRLLGEKSACEICRDPRKLGCCLGGVCRTHNRCGDFWSERDFIRTFPTPCQNRRAQRSDPNLGTSPQHRNIKSSSTSANLSQTALIST